MGEAIAQMRGSGEAAGVYGDYSRARIGWFFGLTGWQLAVVAAGVLPVAWAVQQQAWQAALAAVGAWALVTVVVLTPVRGRSLTGWVLAACGLGLGRATGWTRFTSRAAAGRPGSPRVADLPGALQGLQIHDGPPHGPGLARVAVVQDHVRRTWAVTAALTHPGIGLSDAETRAAFAGGLADLLDLACRTELVEEVLFLVRTVPEDGAERQAWLTRHRTPLPAPGGDREGGVPGAGGGVGLSPAARVRAITDDLHAALVRASVRTEAFVTVVVPERRLARPARTSGGGVQGRARVLHTVMAEVEAALRGGLGMTEVTWLTSPALAVACRTGFAPGDRAGIIDALTAAEATPTGAAAAGGPDGGQPDVPWALAGPSGAEAAPRHYCHDAWNSVSASIILPVRGAAIGALAPVLTPTEPGERRSLLVAYPVLGQQAADRQSATSEWAADLGDEMRHRAKVKQRTRSREETAKVRRLEGKLARGHALTRPYAVATVTVPKTAPAGEFGRRLDAAIRRAGFAPQRLDLAQDVAFAASVVPLGLSLTRRGD